MVLIFIPEHWPLLAVAETSVQVSAAWARLSAASRMIVRIGDGWGLRGPLGQCPTATF